MSELKRIPVKYIRDFIKKDYKLKDNCVICSASEELELHHIYSLSELWNNWCKKNKIPEITTVEQINEYREVFQRDELERLSNDNLYTLCKKHHEQLHKIYGQRYANHLAPRVINWLKIQKEKNGRTS